MKKCIHVDLQYSLTAQIKNVYAVGYIKDGFPTVICAQFTEEIYPVQMLCFCRAELHRTFLIILNNALARQLFKRRASLAPNTFLIFACFVFFQGGLGTTEEMCLSFHYYYPKINLSNCLSCQCPAVENWYQSHYS